MGVAFETARDWLLLLEQFFYLFRLTPFTTRVARALRKEAKVYLFDWAEVEDESIRFENLVALHLLKAVRLWQARRGQDAQSQFYSGQREARSGFCSVRPGPAGVSDRV